MKRVHHHPCQRCGKKAECSGEWEQNYDGFPEVICPEFHQSGGINLDFICEDCAEQPEEEDRCGGCGNACGEGCGHCGRCCNGNCGA